MQLKDHQNTLLIETCALLRTQMNVLTGKCLQNAIDCL